MGFIPGISVVALYNSVGRNKFKTRICKQTWNWRRLLLSQLGEVQSDLAEVSTMLSAFYTIIIGARTTNNRNRYTGLNEDELLFSLKRRLESSRAQIDGW